MCDLVCAAQQAVCSGTTTWHAAASLGRRGGCTIAIRQPGAWAWAQQQRRLVNTWPQSGGLGSGAAAASRRRRAVGDAGGAQSKWGQQPSPGLAWVRERASFRHARVRARAGAGAGQRRRQSSGDAHRQRCGGAAARRSALEWRAEHAGETVRGGVQRSYHRDAGRLQEWSRSFLSTVRHHHCTTALNTGRCMRCCHTVCTWRDISSAYLAFVFRPQQGVDAAVLEMARPFLTGNPDADADIVKFYEAKAKLMQKLSAG